MDATELRRWRLQQPGTVEDRPFGSEHSYALVVSALPKRARETL